LRAGRPRLTPRRASPNLITAHENVTAPLDEITLTALFTETTQPQPGEQKTTG
jgi:hypothetical protein